MNMRAEEVEHRQGLVREGYRAGLEAYRPVAEEVQDSWGATRARVAQSEDVLDYIDGVTASAERGIDFGEYQPAYEKLATQVEKSRAAYIKFAGAENAPTAEAATAKFAEDFAALVEDGTAGWLKEQIETDKPFGLYMFENRVLTREERKARNAGVNPHNHWEWEDRDKDWTDEQLNTTDGTDSPFGFAIVMDEYSLKPATASNNKAKFEELQAQYPSVVIPKDNICLARNAALVTRGE
jgi:hypothetical protein